MHFVQISHPQQGRRVAIVPDLTENSDLQILSPHRTLYDLASEAIARGVELDRIVGSCRITDTIPYSGIYRGRSDWKLLPPFDHPQEPARCLVSGTGLTHKASAESRSRMHQQQPSIVTDSMRMYQWGLERGVPAEFEVGVQPEWFYKGNGSILRAHGETLAVPPFADDGGEEPEVAGAYLIGHDGAPYRVGLVAGNEFSDHRMERQNYLYLAPSKLRACAIGPELVTAEDFQDIPGTVSIERAGAAVWSAEIFTGQKNMSHSLANLEHHHFKYPEHRRPGDVHIHFYGADAFSFGGNFALEDRDIMVVSWPVLGRALRNPVHIAPTSENILQSVRRLG